jgi:hypothetical protein
VRTDELIRMLATGAEPVSFRPPGRRLASGLVPAAIASTVLMAMALGLNPELAATAADPMFWVKLGLGGAVLCAGWLACVRLSQPGAKLGSGPAAIALAAVLGIWMLAALAIAAAGPDQRSALWWGQTWAGCPWNIAALSAPALAATLWAMRGLAPTRLRRAGAAAGLLSGALGALVYTLHCPELAAPFIAVWYLVGMAIPTVAGATLGARALRW